MDKPFFNPWIGSKYQKGINGSGVKVMVLGASHYCDATKPKDPIDTDKKKLELQRYEAIMNCPFRSQEKCMGNSAKYEKLCPCPENGDLNNPSQADSTINVLNSFLSVEDSAISGHQRTFNYFHSAFVPGYVVNPEMRREFWNSVIFYNYYQDFRRNYSEGWFDEGRAKIFFEPFSNFVNEYKPDVIFCWGVHVKDTMIRLANITTIENDINDSTIGTQHPIVMFVKHPSIRFSYSDWHPYIMRALEIAKLRKEQIATCER